MSASLVGSEMCIRDRLWCGGNVLWWSGGDVVVVKGVAAAGVGEVASESAPRPVLGEAVRTTCGVV
eukprot:5860185-Alexandrium_andersonii.AAC.1